MSKIEELLKNEKVEWKTLGEVCDILDYKRKPITKSKRIIGKYPYYGANGVQDYVDDYIFEGTFILMGEDGSVINKDNTPILHWVENSKIWVNNHAHVLGELNSQYILKYIYYYLATVDVSSIVKGTPPKINQGNMKNIQIPIPTIEIQEKIVKILDKFTNYITELQAELQARRKQYEYYRDMLLSEEYLNRLSEKIFIESNNMLYTAKLSEIAELNRGKRVVKSELSENGLYPVYQNSLTPLGYYDDMNFDGDNTCVIAAGAAGEIFYQANAFWAADDVFVLTTRNSSNKYLYYALLNKQSFLKSKVRKASVPRLSRDDLEKIEIVLPPIEIQNKVVEILDQFQSLLSDTQGLLPQEMEQRRKQYEYYREKLLTFGSECDNSTHTS